MKCVIWGAGYTGSKLLHNIGSEKISFFIDSAAEKQGMHLGKHVVLPQTVEDWSDLLIYVPYNYYDEIKIFLLEKGLKEGVDFVKYTNRFQITSNKAEEEFTAALKELDTVAKHWKNGVLYFTSQFLPEIGCLRFMNAMIGKKIAFHLVSEAFWLDKNEVKKRTGITEDIITVPSLWELHTTVIDAVLSEEDTLNLEKNNYLLGIVEQVQDLFPSLGKLGSQYLVYYNYKYISELIRKLQPSQIIYSSGVKPSGRIISNVCREKGISLITSHPGIIPGTLSYDVGGEMGESLPAVYSEEFLALPVYEEDLINAREVWNYLYESKLNRRMQPKNDNIDFIKSRLKKNRPVIFFAGQNDPESHMIPYTENTKRFHSPIFKSSVECGVYLAELCAKNDWNFVYKPHPLYARDKWEEKFPPSAIYIKSGNVNDLIDISDVTITILSATSYNALTRYKPVVMLGYTQLRGKGCNYEAFEKDKIEAAIKEALEKGFTKDQQEAFLKHVAQCLKYYLYDDLQERPIRYGRSVPKSIDEFYELERLLTMIN